MNTNTLTGQIRNSPASKLNYRLILACLLAMAVSFPMGVISLAKLLLLLGAVIALLSDGWQLSVARRTTDYGLTSAAILIALAAFALSMVWTTAAWSDASHAFSKHAKMLAIPLLLLLIRSRAEATRAIAFFLGAQIFVLMCSWLKLFQVALPFPTQPSSLYQGLVFAEHLDQPIMLATAAAVGWHLRSHYALGRFKSGTIVFALLVLTVANVLFEQTGLTGYLTMVAMLGLAGFWALPRRYKWVTVAGPFLVATAVGVMSPRVQDRVSLVWKESLAYQQSGDIESSSGERLNYWYRSLQAIAERPLLGYGVGSWNMQYNRLEGGKGRLHTYQIRNPHQEFLLWMVEAGVLGLVLLMSLLACAVRDTRQMDPSERQATTSVLTVIVLSCLFNSTIFDAQIGDFLCVALGLCLAMGLRGRDQKLI
jgi:O-antigen ligase